MRRITPALRRSFRPWAAPFRASGPAGGRRCRSYAPLRAGIAAIAAFATAVTLAVVLAGCAPAGPSPASAGPSPVSTGPSPASTVLPDGLTAEIVQLRSDVATRQAQVQLRNGGAEDLTIGALAVTDPRFAEAATRVLDRESRLRAGGAIDVRIQLPAMDCGVPDAGVSTVELTYAAGQDAPARVAAPIGDPLDFLAPLHNRECRAETVADAATLGFASFTPSLAGQPAQLALEIAPTGAGAVEIVGIRPTNLLSFAASPGSTPDLFPIDLAVSADHSAPTTVRVPLVPFRCDPHAVQEDKRGTIFTLVVRVGSEPGNDAELGEIELAAPGDMRGEILTWVANWCGFGPG